MMKYFILLITFLLLGSSVLNSQITIGANDITITNGQTIYEQSLNLGAFSDFQVGADMQWDYSNAGFDGDNFFYEYIAPPVSMSFPTATSAQDVLFTMGASGFYVPAKTFYELNQTGYYELGSEYEFTEVPLNQDGTAYAKVEAQSSLFKPAPRLGFPLPMVYNETQTITPEPFKRDIDIIINIPPTLNNAPFRNEFIVTNSFKTVGWGKLKLAGYENEEDVIVLERKRNQIDSFYLYGSPAPEALLSQYGLVQGSSASHTTLFFYAKGYPQQIMTLILDSEGKVEYAKQMNYNPTMNVENQNLTAKQTNVYPNPTNSEFTIDTKDYADARNIEVFSSDGILLLKKKVDVGSSLTNLKLNNAPSGSYLYSIITESGKVLSSGKIMIAK